MSKQTTLPESILTKRQTIEKSKTITYDGRKAKIYVQIRHDDCCGNGHNSFAITGDIYSSLTSKADRYSVIGGCIHDEIGKYFPEYKHLIKWHLTSTDEPLHYVANTTYHARTTSHDGKQVGDAVAWDNLLQFGDFPIQSKSSGGLIEFVKATTKLDDVEIIEVPYVKRAAGSDYNFEPKYTFKGMSDVWHECDFDNHYEALGFLEAWGQHGVEVVAKPTRFVTAVEPDIDAARRCAIWPEATLEQLQDKEQLMNRLPELMQRFKADVEAFGLVY